MNDLVLTGLDGKNPLGFLAALGVLRAVAENTRPGVERPRLGWRMLDTYRPYLSGVSDGDVVIDVAMRDAESFLDDPVLELKYRKVGADENAEEAHDLKPRPERFAQYLANLVRLDNRRGLTLAAAFATDVAKDNNGNTKPTAFHFTAGQQQFLAMVASLRNEVVRDDFAEAIFGPWKYARPLPVLGWDNAQTRDYALRASDPSKEKRLGVPGADWLAFRGLSFIGVAPVGSSVQTTGCHGGWKTGSFRWPLWAGALDEQVVGSILTSPEIFEMSPVVLRARGIDVVFESMISRSEQGGYGSFSPAGVARPTES